MLWKKCFIVFTSAIQRFQTLRAMGTEMRNKCHMFKKFDFHLLFTTVVYQQIENSERANQIHRFTIEHCTFILKLDRNTDSTCFLFLKKMQKYIIVSKRTFKNIYKFL